MIITSVSDVACPWCHLGRAFLHDAIRTLQAAGVEVEVRWLAFHVDPGVHPSGEEIRSYVVRRFGNGAVKEGGVMEALRERAKESRIVHYGNWVTASNTLNALRAVMVIRKFYGWKAVDDALELLFQAVYEEGKNISLMSDVLETLSPLPGVERDVLHRAGDSEYAQAVADEDRHVRTELGVTGVPHYFVECGGRTLQIRGCRTEEQWLAAIRTLRN